MRWPFLRDLILFFCGLTGVAYETLVENADRPSLLLIFGAMMGLPIVLGADRKRNGDE